MKHSPTNQIIEGSWPSPQICAECCWCLVKALITLSCPSGAVQTFLCRLLSFFILWRCRNREVKACCHFEHSWKNQVAFLAVALNFFPSLTPVARLDSQPETGLWCSRFSRAEFKTWVREQEIEGRFAQMKEAGNFFRVMREHKVSQAKCLYTRNFT